MPAANKPTKTVVIAISTSLSPAINIGSHKDVGIIMPDIWDAANLTFQASNTVGGDFQDMHNDAGTEISVTAAAGRSIPVGDVLKQIGQFQFIKIRSGTSGTPVVQTAARTIILVLG